MNWSLRHNTKWIGMRTKIWLFFSWNQIMLLELFPLEHSALCSCEFNIPKLEIIILWQCHDELIFVVLLHGFQIFLESLSHSCFHDDDNYVCDSFVVVRFELFVFFYPLILVSNFSLCRYSLKNHSFLNQSH